MYPFTRSVQTPRRLSSHTLLSFQHGHLSLQPLLPSPYSGTLLNGKSQPGEQHILYDFVQKKFQV